MTMLSPLRCLYIFIHSNVLKTQKKCKTLNTNSQVCPFVLKYKVCQSKYGYETGPSATGEGYLYLYLLSRVTQSAPVSLKVKLERKMTSHLGWLLLLQYIENKFCFFEAFEKIF